MDVKVGLAMNFLDGADASAKIRNKSTRSHRTKEKITRVNCLLVFVRVKIRNLSFD